MYQEVLRKQEEDTNSGEVVQNYGRKKIISLLLIEEIQSVRLLG